MYVSKADAFIMECGCVAKHKTIILSSRMRYDSTVLARALRIDGDWSIHWQLEGNCCSATLGNNACQVELQSSSRASHVEFDYKTESTHTVSHHFRDVANCKILELNVDCRLIMCKAIANVVAEKCCRVLSIAKSAAVSYRHRHNKSVQSQFDFLCGMPNRHCISLLCFESRCCWQGPAELFK